MIPYITDPKGLEELVSTHRDTALRMGRDVILVLPARDDDLPLYTDCSRQQADVVVIVRRLRHGPWSPFDVDILKKRELNHATD